MKKYISLLFILINLSAPLFPFEYSWHLILDRQTATNRYGYEFNGFQGIQDEELVPDPNGNKEVDKSEGKEAADFIFEKANSLSAIEYLEKRNFWIGNCISAVQIEQKWDILKEIIIQTIEGLILKLENSSVETKIDQLKIELAKNGYQADIGRGIIYLANGSIELLFLG